MAVRKRANNRKVKIRKQSRKKPKPVAPGSLFNYMETNKIQTFPITHKGTRKVRKTPRRPA